MAIAFVTGTGADGAGSSTTIAIPAFVATAGNDLIIMAQNYTTGQPTVASIADTAGNAAKFAIAGSVEHADGSNSMEMWVAHNILGHATNVVTVTFSGAAEFRVGIAVQYSGLALAGSFDQSAAILLDPSSTTTHTTNTTGTTAQADELILGFYSAWGDPRVLSATSPYTLRVNVSTGNAAAVDRIVSGTGTYSITMSSTVGDRYVSIVRTFKMAAAAGIKIPVVYHHRQRNF